MKPLTQILQRLKEPIVKWLEKSGLKARIEPQLARYRALTADKKKQLKTGLVFAVIVANLFLVLAPMLNASMVMRQKVQKVSSEVRIANSDIKSKDHVAEALTAAESATRETERRTFKSDEVHQFLDVLSDMAKQTRVNIESLAPIKVSSAPEEMPRPLPKGYALAGFELSGKAGYFEFLDFISRLENAGPFVRIESLKIFHDVSESRKSHQVKMRFLLIRRE